ncbi:MAG: response regulator [Paludibacter sp.]|nr:response regulator [Paludibacter sp.]
MKTNITIVSDEYLFWNLIIPLLSSKLQDIRIDICKSIQEIDDKLDAGSCKLVIVDGGMSRMSSIEVIQYLRLKKGVLSPVWFFPEIQTNAYIYKAYEMGATRILNKPFDPYQVIDEIMTLIGQQTYKSAV